MSSTVGITRSHASSMGLSLDESHRTNSMESEEECSTGATSSMSSLSPDNPMYHRPLQERGVEASVPSELPRSSSLNGLNRTGSRVEIVSPLHSFDALHQARPVLEKAPIETIREQPPTSQSAYFEPQHFSTRFLQRASSFLLRRYYSQHHQSTWIGFWALLFVTCSNYVLTPMRDAVALHVGVHNLPKLTLASTLLAFVSSVPIGWLFEAPDPQRRKVWKRMGLTRGETQGTSLALFYRFFMISILTYALGFFWFKDDREEIEKEEKHLPALHFWSLLQQLGQFMYIAFFLVVHLMKLHSLSLVWGVTTEAMEYEDLACKKGGYIARKTRYQRLAFISFGGTVGGILGSFFVSSMAHVLHLSGLLVVAALLLELSAELSIEMGRIMQLHWEEQQISIRNSSENLSSLDTSMKRSASMGSMKRVASGNSLNKVRSLTELAQPQANGGSGDKKSVEEPVVDDNTFYQRLLRGISTILRSRLLMAIFTYNALYASTTVLLSFQRAALVVGRNNSSSTESDTAFLANINMASSVAVFALQATGAGGLVAHRLGSQGTLSLMPVIRLMVVLALAWWHRSTNGRPPNLILFLVLDECTRVMNLAIAKPVRESLWRGLSNEARYEAKPIVDTLANRWGGGSAAFLVSFTDKVLEVSGLGRVHADGSKTVLGYPPVLFLCMIIAAWWAMVSADLGQIRRKIDLELKKHQ